jgi:dTDP-4-dehydrorhamnose reductase
MRVLVIGAAGQLGRALLAAPRPAGWSIAGAISAEIDITQPATIERGLDRMACDIVVNAAAYTAVDRAESEPERAFMVNRDGAGHLAEACARRGLRLIHVSTDYVFDGNASRPYREDDPVNPLSVYGRSKAQGEAAVRERLAEHCILRLSWLYSVMPPNFVRTMVSAALASRPLRVVSDQVGAPTIASDAASAILALAARKDDAFPGTWHFSASGAVSWHGFARRILEFLSEWGYQVPPLAAISSEEYGAAAVRPKNSQLDCGKLDRMIGLPRRDWQEPLAFIVRQNLEDIGVAAR